VSSAASNSSAIAARGSAVPRPSLRPLVLPTEHGGWGFLFEPLLLGIAVAPSFAGFLIAAAALFGFLTRQPLKLAMQDALRGKSYPRTRWCRGFAVGYLFFAAMALLFAVALRGWMVVVPFALVAPLAIITVVADAKNRSRALLPEVAGSIAMASTAGAIALAGGRSPIFALAASSLIVLRGIPSIIYVRTLLTRAHKQGASSWPALVAHAVAIGVAFVIASWIAAAAAFSLLVRAAWGLTHEVPRAQTLGWREIAWGAMSVAAFAVALKIA
jgi:hypothetical protein